MEKLTTTELYAWNFMEDHSDQLLSSKISEIAELAHCSTATIIRAIKKQGYSGYYEYRLHLKNRKMLHQSARSDFSESSLALIEKNREEINRTLELLSAEEMKKIIVNLNNAKTIYVISAGPTKSVGRYLTNKLQFSGKNCLAIEDQDFMIFHAKKMTANDFLIAISLRGETEELVVTSTIANRKGTTVLSITSEPESTLASLSDFQILSYKSKMEKYNYGTDIASRIPLEVSARVLLDLYAIYKEQHEI